MIFFKATQKNQTSRTEMNMHLESYCNYQFEQQQQQQQQKWTAAIYE